jgi:hypothetical protein
MFGDEQFYPNSIKREKRETNQDEKNGPKKKKRCHSKLLPKFVKIHKHSL